MFKKILVIGIIIMFLGVGIQPVFAITSNTSNINEDCGCQPINNVDFVRIKFLQKKLDAFTKSILSKYKQIPENNKFNNEKSEFIIYFEFLEKNNELLNSIKSIKPFSIRPLCVYLKALYNIIINQAEFCFEYLRFFQPGDHGILYYVVTGLVFYMLAIFTHIIGLSLLCRNFFIPFP